MLFGECGFPAIADLENQFIMMSENVKKMESDKNRLSGKIKLLENDPESLKIEARSLGYLDRNEKMIKMIPALEPDYVNQVNKVIDFIKPEFTSDIVLKLISATAALCAGMLLILTRKKTEKHIIKPDALERKSLYQFYN